MHAPCPFDAAQPEAMPKALVVQCYSVIVLIAKISQGAEGYPEGHCDSTWSTLPTGTICVDNLSIESHRPLPSGPTRRSQSTISSSNSVSSRTQATSCLVRFVTSSNIGVLGVYYPHKRVSQKAISCQAVMSRRQHFSSTLPKCCQQVTSTRPFRVTISPCVAKLVSACTRV